MRLKHRTMRLDIEHGSLDTAIRELLAVKKSLHGLHVNTNETGIIVDEHFEPYESSPTLRIMLHYKSAMTAEELLAEQYTEARYKADRLAEFNRLLKEFGEK